MPHGELKWEMSTRMDAYDFGYPRECHNCIGCSKAVHLRVEPYLQESGSTRIMLVGQDPTIARNPERVTHVLMLNEKNGQLRRWLADLLGEENFNSSTLYATNVVKCSFDSPPGTLRVLKPYFDSCKHYLIDEIIRFQPQVLLTFGESAHRLLIRILDNDKEFREPMKEAFTGRFQEGRLRGVRFRYSPCLHIKTFRVADTYGDKAKRFRVSLHDNLT